MFYRIILALLINTLLYSATPSYAKHYHKEYYTNGNLKAEGWINQNGIKTDFWIYYYPNGNVSQKGHFKNNQKNGYWFFYSKTNELIKEGHYINNKAEKWWIIYDKLKKIIKKCQFKNDKRNGFCLLYKKNKLFKAERFTDDMKTGEWTDVLSFKKDNPNATL